jgi:hypothetical protein
MAMATFLRSYNILCHIMSHCHCPHKTCFLSQSEVRNPANCRQLLPLYTLYTQSEVTQIDSNSNCRTATQAKPLTTLVFCPSLRHLAMSQMLPS